MPVAGVLAAILLSSVRTSIFVASSNGHRLLDALLFVTKISANPSICFRFNYYFCCSSYTKRCGRRESYHWQGDLWSHTLELVHEIVRINVITFPRISHSKRENFFIMLLFLSTAATIRIFITLGSVIWKIKYRSRPQ